MSELVPVFAAAVLERLEPPQRDAAEWPEPPGTAYEDLPPGARRAPERDELLGLVESLLRPDLPAPEQGERRVFDPGDGRPYVFDLVRGPLRLSVAARCPSGASYVAARVRTPPASGPWPVRIRAAAAELAPGWRALVEKAVARPDEVDPRADLLATWIYVGALDPGFGQLYLASDGTTTVFALTPNVHESVEPEPPPSPDLFDIPPPLE